MGQLPDVTKKGAKNMEFSNYMGDKAQFYAATVVGVNVIKRECTKIAGEIEPQFCCCYHNIGS